MRRSAFSYVTGSICVKIEPIYVFGYIFAGLQGENFRKGTWILMKIQTIYLVDTENVNEIWVDAIAAIQPRDKVVAFYTDNSPKLSWERMADFAAKGCEFEAIGCHKGTNALDFQLVSYLGYMIASKTDCRYVIISNDKGYDPVSYFWQERGIQIKRQPVQMKIEKKTNPQPISKESVVLKIFKKVTGQSQVARTEDTAAGSRDETGSAELPNQASGQAKSQIRSDRVSARTGTKTKLEKAPARTGSKAKSDQASVQTKSQTRSDRASARTGEKAKLEKVPARVRPKSQSEQTSVRTEAKSKSDQADVQIKPKTKSDQVSAGTGARDGAHKQLTSSKGWEQIRRPVPDPQEAQAVRCLSKSIPFSKEVDFRQSLNHLLGEDLGNRVFEQLQDQENWKKEADRAYLANANGRLRNYVEVFLRMNHLPQTDRPEICKLLRQADTDHLADLHREFVKRFDDEHGTAYYKLFKGNLRVIQSMLKS